MVFETADAAVFAASEMQHRCSLLPQLSGHRIALRVGIHRSLMRQRSKDPTENPRKIAELLATADDRTLISAPVFDDINDELKKLPRPVAEPAPGVDAYAIDWRSGMPSAAYGGESLWPDSEAPQPPGAYLRLHYGLKTLELSPGNRVIAIGRAPTNDLILTDERVSRHHCAGSKAGPMASFSSIQAPTAPA